MKIIRTFKYRVYPTRKQEQDIAFCLETSRLLYNHLLAEKRNAWKYEHRSIPYFSLYGLVKGNRLLHSHLVSGVIHRVDFAFKNFFKKCKDPNIKKKGFPRLKSIKSFSTLYYPYKFHPRILGRHTAFPQIGFLKTSYDRPIQGKPKTLALKKTLTNKYFITIVCEIEIKVPKKNSKPAVGIDVGLNHAITTSDGQFFDSPKPLKVLSKKLIRQHRKFSRTKLHSHNHEKERLKLAKIYERISDIRKDWNHKVTTILAKSYGTIKVESLNIQGMLKNHKLAKSISDVAWGDLIQKLTYKAESAGGRVIKVNPANTSQLCSACGALVPKKLKERTHNCPNCGLVLDRDINAAKNILTKKEIPKGFGESKPVRESVRRPKRAPFSMTQESISAGIQP